MNKRLNFGGNLGILRCKYEQKTTIIVLAYPDRSAGNDPEALGLAFHHGLTFNNNTVKLLQTWSIEAEDYQSKLV